MSNYTRAWALVREVSDRELRDALIDANERILDAAEELNDGSDEPGDLEAGVYNATEWRDTLQDVADKAECSTDGVADWIKDAIEKLATVPKADADGTPTEKLLADKTERLEDALVRIEALEAERALLKAEVRQLEAAAMLPDDLRSSVGDVLAMSRKLTSFCEAAGIKPATLRVTRSRKKAS